MEYIVVVLIAVVILFVILYIRERRLHGTLRQSFEESIASLTELRIRTTLEGEQIRRQEQSLIELRGECSRLEQAKGDAERTAVRLESEGRHLREQLGEAQQRLRDQALEQQTQFREIATKIIEERSQNLSQRNEETLRPLREDIERLGKRVEETYSSESRERISLQTIVRELMQQSGTLSSETNALIKALKGDSKVQGDWGEMILENILQSSGLRRGEEYTVQETLRDEQGAVLRPSGGKSSLRPDVIVHYPNGGAMVIDSKVSLTAYSRYVAAESDEERSRFAREHLESVLKHVKELAEKRYPDFVEGAPDFVVLFIPNEPAYSLALSQAPSLWEEAYKSGVVLINGTNLIAVLRMAQDMWQRDRQIKNVEDIVKKASAMYDKFCLYATTLEETEERMNRAVDSLRRARGQLSEGKGNLVRQMENLRLMGLKNSRRIPPSFLSEEDRGSREFPSG